MQKSLTKLLNILLPKRCLSCNTSGSWLCSTCTTLIQQKKTQTCYLCGKPSFFGETCDIHLNKSFQKLNGLLICAHYDGNPILKKAIKTMKYLHHAEDIGNKLGNLLSKTFLPFFNHANTSICFIPVPLHSSRQKERGFNQSELLSAELFGRLKQFRSGQISLDITSLQREKNTLPQASCTSRKERIENLSEAFQSQVMDKNTSYVLVDDVCTTGKTLEECCKELKKNGAETVWGLVLARNR